MTKPIYGIFCNSEECEFELLEKAALNTLRHKLTDMEGAIVSDGEGGYYSICPLCKEDELQLITD